MMIFVTQQTNRLLYVLQFAFEQWSKISYQLTQSEDKFIVHTGPKINYSDTPLCKDEILIYPSGFLNETSYRFFSPDSEKRNETMLLFPSKKTTGNSYPFDIFSAVFYMLSRYEEYGNKAKDKYGRFPAKESLAYNHKLPSFAHC